MVFARVSAQKWACDPSTAPRSGAQASLRLGALEDRGTVERLRKRADFVAASREGRSQATAGLVALLRPHTGLCRIGFTASRKVGGAVARNRARRRLRAAVSELLRTHARLFSKGDYVFIARRTTLTRPYLRLCADLEYALRTLRKAR